ncbi:glycosyl transferase family 2 [Oceanobacillus caeni]
MGVKFEFLIKINKDATDLLILGSGSYDPNKMSPPIFQRHTWIDDFKETVIFYNDPTLYLDKITIGWGQGSEDRHYLYEQSHILEVLIKKMKFQREQVYFYGSSAGGFMSLMLAGFIRGTTAIVNNPQTLVMNFWPSPVRDMLNASYPNLSREEVEDRFLCRINVVEFYKKIGYVPPIYYLQNVSAKRDVDSHLIPFIEGLKDLSDELFSSQLNLKLYANEEQGHSPVNKKETLTFISTVIKG